MLTLSSTLLAAQGRYDVLPDVSVLVSDSPPEAPRLSEIGVVNPPGTLDVAFDACFTQAGTIGRIRDNAGLIQAQVVLPSAGTWATWTTLGSTGGTFAGACQVAIRGSLTDGTADAFWVISGDLQIKTAHWNGSSWGAVSIVYTAPTGTITGLASDGADPTLRLFFVINADFLYETHWTGSAWSTPLADGASPTWIDVPTIAVGFRPTTAPNGDGNAYVYVCAGSPTVLTVKAFGITGFSGWGGSAVVLSAGVGSGYSYAYPKLAQTRADSLRQCICWSETAPSPIGTMPMVAFSPTHSSVQGAVPWRYGGSHGLKVFRDVASSPSYWFLSSNQVYSASCDPLGTGAKFSFPHDQVESFKIDLPRPNQRGTGQVTVLNNGRLSTAGVAGNKLCLRPWSQVAIALGYRTPAGLESAWQVPLWVTSVSFHDEVARGQGLVTLNLTDAWGILESVYFRSTVTYTGQSAEYLLQRCLWNVCGDLVTLGSILSGLTVSPFTVKAGESVALVARRLCDLVGVDLVFSTIPTSVDGTGFDSVGVVAVARGSGGSVYSYGAAAHPVVQSEIWPAVASSYSGELVSGLGTLSLVRNWGPTWMTWRDSLHRTVDKTLANQAATDAVSADRAASLLTEQAGGTIRVLANVGQEMGDQVDVTIPSAGLAAEVFTVSGVTTSWVTDSGRTQGRGLVPTAGRMLQTLKLSGSR